MREFSPAGGSQRPLGSWLLGPTIGHGPVSDDELCIEAGLGRTPGEADRGVLHTGNDITITINDNDITMLPGDLDLLGRGRGHRLETGVRRGLEAVTHCVHLQRSRY